MKRLILLLLLPLCLHAEQLSPEQTNDLLSRVTEKRRGVPMQAEFREEKHMSLMQKPVVETGTLAFLPPDKFRREVKGRSLTVCDGTTLWLYYPEFNEAEKYSLSSNKALRESLNAMSSGFGLQEIGKNFAVQAVKAPDGYQLTLSPKNSALRKSVAQIVITLADDLSVRRMEIQSVGGDKTVTDFSNERRSQLSPADFQFQPPDGTTVSEPLK